MWQSIKQKIRRRLFEAIEAERNSRQAQMCCQLGAGSQVFPEAQIRNLAGVPERIQIGENTFIRGSLQTQAYGGRIELGDWCYVGHRSEIWSSANIRIGNRVLISHDVNIHDSASHPIEAALRHRHFRHIIEQDHPKDDSLFGNFAAAPMVIEDDVWISFGVTILKGVRIGRGSVIGAGSMVLADVPPNSVYTCDVVPRVRPLPEESAI